MSRCQIVHFLWQCCWIVLVSDCPSSLMANITLVITEQFQFHAARCYCLAILLLRCHSFSTLSHHLHRNGWHGLSKTHRQQKDQQGCAAPLDTELPPIGSDDSMTMRLTIHKYEYLNTDSVVLWPVTLLAMWDYRNNDIQDVTWPMTMCNSWVLYTASQL